VIARNQAKPVRLSTQRLIDVTCTMCSINNFLQDIIFDKYTTYKEVMWDTFVQMKAQQGMKPEQIAGLYSEFIGPAGVSPTLAICYLRRVLGYNADSVRTDDKAALKALQNGILSVTVNNSFGHCLTLVNGWVIDSIPAKGLYKWTGEVLGYTSVEWIAVWHVYQGRPTVQKPIVIDMRFDTSSED
jgi:hypothetical protein